MSATNPDRPDDEEHKDVDQNAIAQVEGEIRAFVRKDLVRKDFPWRRSQAQQAEQPRDVPAAPVARDLTRELPMDGVNSLIGRVAGQSTEQIDKLISDLEAVRSLLRGEGERLQRELLGYADMSQTAMTSIKVISESVSQWKSTMNTPRPERT